MKKIILIGILILIVFVSGCKKEINLKNILPMEKEIGERWVTLITEPIDEEFTISFFSVNNYELGKELNFKEGYFSEMANDFPPDLFFGYNQERALGAKFYIFLFDKEHVKEFNIYLKNIFKEEGYTQLDSDMDIGDEGYLYFDEIINLKEYCYHFTKNNIGSMVCCKTYNETACINFIKNSAQIISNKI